MSGLAFVLVALVALEHLAFMALEAYWWTKPLGLRVFAHTPEQARASATLAANQGLYNGLLGAGLLYSLAFPGPASQSIARFILSFAVVAGVFGGLTASRSIFLLQAVPAAAALAVLAL
jgi:putative membrane protein